MKLILLALLAIGTVINAAPPRGRPESGERPNPPPPGNWTRDQRPTGRPDDSSVDDHTEIPDGDHRGPRNFTGQPLEAHTEVPRGNHTEGGRGGPIGGKGPEGKGPRRDRDLRNRGGDADHSGDHTEGPETKFTGNPYHTEVAKFEDHTEVPRGNNTDGAGHGGPMGGKGPERNGPRRARDVRHRDDMSAAGRTEGPEHQFAGNQEDHTGRPMIQYQTEEPRGGNYTVGGRGGPVGGMGGKGPEGRGPRRNRDVRHDEEGKPEDHTGQPQFEDRTGVPRGNQSDAGHGGPTGGRGPGNRGPSRGEGPEGQKPARQGDHTDRPVGDHSVKPEDHTGLSGQTKKPEVVDHTEGVRPGGRGLGSRKP